MNLPLFAKERTAAKLLDMTTKEFRDLVWSRSPPLPSPSVCRGALVFNRNVVNAVCLLC